MTSMWKAQNASLKRPQNTMLIDTFTSPPTAPTYNLRPNFTLLRQVNSLLLCCLLGAGSHMRYLSQARGEQVARRVFPEATLVRPAPMFGFEDNLLLKLASVLNLFTANNMQETFWPVHSIDVGAALEKLLYDDSTTGQTFELYGPKQYSMGQIAAMVDKEIFKQRRHINVPKRILKPIASVLNRALWWHTISADEVEREFMDQIIDPTAKTFKDLGIEPGDIADFTYHYLQGFRSQNYYDLPPATEKEKREDKKYIHVLDEL
ncbi:NADH-ubiquinone oxidoreductase 40 kDa subunit-like protein [Metarhizium album ARSEF 1941]|uniref:NADH-ubiquinone oxidoreductase 40 kDa subunit-like protein n=1 Tax=Metarhizium album (strain ARSEF 1941) TaxID=1081103 RepID=A0A0B2X6N2_METAS|nr:NADH-ubiquinone oxidoreductase 40 kDa subunit-like protein [Metarhizium album ARSEF 1941]KHO01130.1 NADH-ubiquinone oxidoreductase 40 kDa subunit-like protein [Metarhizium album ARSEF 1941]